MIIPSIDLMLGRAVQLRRGKEKILERDNPCELASDFARFGEIAVIDLDAALAQGHNEKLIGQICALAECRVGGGIRSLEKAARILDSGAHKIIIGTRIFNEEEIDFSFLESLNRAFGRKRLIIALDSYEGCVVTKGWRHRTGRPFQELLPELESYAGEFLFTCVEREGMLEGIDRSAVERFSGSTKLPITAAGGIASLEEIARLSRPGVNLQLGMSLYTGRFSLEEAFLADLNWKDSLLPTITRDRAGRVLMLAYSSRESLRKTFSTGRVWYYSRSRKKLWMKGESSGNVQDFRSIRRDCDGDTLLITAEPKGPACHTGEETCFGAKDFRLEDLFSVVSSRLVDGPAGSYTSSLDSDSLTRKLHEELEEFLDAPSQENLIWEAADLLYFMTVRLCREGIVWEDVRRELGRRRRAAGAVKNQGEGRDA